MDRAMLEARFTIMGMEVSLRYVDEVAYMQFGGKWYVVSGDILNGAGEEAIPAAVDVLAYVPEIISSSVEVRGVGDESVGGFECVKMEVVPDPVAIAGLEPVRRLVSEMDMDADELVEYLREADLVVEVWVQKDEPAIRRVYLAASMDMPSVGDLAGLPILPEKARVEILIDFPEYGVVVDVQAPAEATPFEGL